MNDNVPEPVARDFVFAGARILEKDKIGYEVLPIDDDGKISRAMLFAEPKLKGSVVGGIYEGAEFSDKKSRGLGGRLRFKGKYAGPDAVEREIAWKAENDSALAERRHKAFVADAKKVSAIDTAMLPIRTAYAAARARGDYAQSRAIEIAVLESLRRPVKG